MQRLGRGAQGVEILGENLDDDLRGDAREQMVDAVADRGRR
nr:hypothetical protein [Hankyongella ginsenosidimutans]